MLLGTFMIVWSEILFILCLLTKIITCKILNNFQNGSSSENQDEGPSDTPMKFMHHNNLIMGIDIRKW